MKWSLSVGRKNPGGQPDGGYQILSRMRRCGLAWGAEAPAGSGRHPAEGTEV